MPLGIFLSPCGFHLPLFKQLKILHLLIVFLHACDVLGLVTLVIVVQLLLDRSTKLDFVIEVVPDLGVLLRIRRFVSTFYCLCMPMMIPPNSFHTLSILTRGLAYCIVF